MIEVISYLIFFDSPFSFAAKFHIEFRERSACLVTAFSGDYRQLLTSLRIGGQLCWTGAAWQIVVVLRILGHSPSTFADVRQPPSLRHRYQDVPVLGSTCQIHSFAAERIPT